jgi:hypothetical protein
MRPAKAAPARCSQIRRYENARTIALPIIAAFRTRRYHTKPPCLTYTHNFQTAPCCCQVGAGQMMPAIFSLRSYSSFTKAFETLDLEQAKASLDELALRGR